jgi:hypothetical protein
MSANHEYLIDMFFLELNSFRSIFREFLLKILLLENKSSTADAEQIGSMI